MPCTKLSPACVNTAKREDLRLQNKENCSAFRFCKYRQTEIWEQFEAKHLYRANGICSIIPPELPTFQKAIKQFKAA